MPEQEKNASPPAPAFAAGDKVHWTHCAQRGSTINLRTRHGAIVGFSTPTGQKAQVKIAGGRKYWVLVKKLRKEEEPTHLTEAFVAVGEALVAAGGCSNVSAKVHLAPGKEGL